MVFMRGGELTSLRKVGPEEEHALSLLGTNIGQVRKALKALDGTLVIQSRETGQYSWRFKHPTIRDAFGSLIADEPDLMIVYLAGMPVKSLLNEITCGKMRIKGVKLIIPQEQWPQVISRLDELDLDDEEESEVLEEFLANRCHRDFLRLYLEQHPDLVGSLEYGSWMRYHSSVLLAARLHSCRLLSKAERRRFVDEARELAVRTPDADFLDVPRIRAMFRHPEIESILREVSRQLGPQLQRRISRMRSSCITLDRDPEEHFWLFRRALRIYRHHFWKERRGCRRFEVASDRVRNVVERLKKKRAKMETKLAVEADNVKDVPSKTRSIFDDVDQ
jgi:hypothetical protein